MDFLDPKKKRVNKIKLYVGYALMTIAIIFGAITLLYAAFGYGVKRDGQVYQNSTVFLASQPDNVDVEISNTVNNDIKKTSTSDRLILEAGNYNFRFSKQDYRTWQRDVELRGGIITRLDYPFLFPIKLISKDIIRYPSEPGLITTSPDRSKQLVQRPSSFLEYDLIDKNSDTNNIKRVAFAPALFSDLANKSTLQLIEWSSDNRHLLVSYKAVNGKRFVLMDTDKPAESININSFYNKNFLSVRLRDKSPDNLYFLTSAGVLETGTIESKTRQKVLSNVSDFQPYKNDQILFINNKNQAKTGLVSAQIYNPSEPILMIKKLPKSKTYYLELSEYRGNFYAVVGASSGKDEFYVFRNPRVVVSQKDQQSLFTRTIRLDGANQLSLSDNARFIATENDSKFAVYDIEEDKLFKYELDKKYKSVVSHDWMDGHRIIVQAEGKVLVFDFDGSNQQYLFNTVAGYQIGFNSEYSNIDGLVKDDSKLPYAIKTFDLIVD